MAVEQSIILAVGSTPEKGTLQLRPLDEGKFQNFDSDINTLE